MPYRETIAAAYDLGVEEELNRLADNFSQNSEFALITNLLDSYISSGSTIVDIGSGPGRYAEYLLKKGCKVGLVDLSANSLKAFSNRIEGSCCEQNIIFNKVSCATQIDWIPDHSANAVLLMGPLYHLINEAHRQKVLRHCYRILKPGGYLFTVFLSPFPVLIQNNSVEQRNLLFHNPLLHRHITGEITTHTHFQGFNVPQFRIWPKDARLLLLKNGFRTLKIKNIEGASSFFQSQSNANVIKEVEGITHQFFAVSMKMLMA